MTGAKTSSAAPAPDDVEDPFEGHGFHAPYRTPPSGLGAM